MSQNIGKQGFGFAFEMFTSNMFHCKVRANDCAQNDRLSSDMRRLQKGGVVAVDVSIIRNNLLEELYSVVLGNVAPFYAV